MLLYFLVNVLSRHVDAFWQSSESKERYVTSCVAAMGKCPPSIFGLLVYLEARPDQKCRDLGDSPDRASCLFLLVLAFVQVLHEPAALSSETIATL